MNILTFPISFLRSFKEEWLLFLYLNYPFIDRFEYPQYPNRDLRVPMGTRFYTLLGGSAACIEDGMLEWSTLGHWQHEVD